MHQTFHCATISKNRVTIKPNNDHLWISIQRLTTNVLRWWTLYIYIYISTHITWTQKWTDSQTTFFRKTSSYLILYTLYNYLLPWKFVEDLLWKWVIFFYNNMLFILWYIFSLMTCLTSYSIIYRAISTVDIFFLLCVVVVLLDFSFGATWWWCHV